MADLVLYSARICPFCQRTRLALREKNIEFDLIEIDLNDKPQGFTEISPFGTVPALGQGQLRLWESTIINEYLEEIFPSPALLPADSGRKAEARIWIDFAGSRFVPPFYQLLKEQDETRRIERRQQILDVFNSMEHQGMARLSGDGPFWLGSELSLVDLAYYPWFERWTVLEHYRQMPLPTGFPRLERWHSAMRQRSAVQQDRESDGFYIEGYRDYAEGRK